nr:MAG TPA: hypothetical protein [Caudoviricetes sp.]
MSKIQNRLRMSAFLYPCKAQALLCCDHCEEYNAPLRP